jgi:hypothetical protein
MKNIDHQLRNILKCTFVESVIVSNHNPDVRIEDLVSVKDRRVITLNQDVKRACGYRWRIARQLAFEYLVMIDDDILLFPNQLRILCRSLFAEPETPHGFSGMVHLQNGKFDYRERENREVDFLCEVYGVSRVHVERYFELEGLLAKIDQTFPDDVERLGDFIVISQTGVVRPKIHNSGKLLRSKTYTMPGVANHKDDEFDVVLVRVSQAVEKIHQQTEALV